MLYLVAIVSTFYQQWLAQALYVLVALMWLLPDRRIEYMVAEKNQRDD